MRSGVVCVLGLVGLLCTSVRASAGQARSALVLDTLDENKTGLVNGVGDGTITLTSVVNGTENGHELYSVVDYTIEQVDGAGGALVMGSLLDNTTALYDCSGADSFEFGFQNLAPQSATGRGTLKVTLLDGFGCRNYTLEDCSMDSKLEWWTASFPGVLDFDADGTWHTLAVGLGDNVFASDQFTLDGSNGRVDNSVLDLGFIQGFRIELVIDGTGSISSTTNGSFALDDIRCSGTVFGFNLGQALPVWGDLKQTYTIGAHSSTLAMENTNVELHPAGKLNLTSPVLEVNYFVEQTEAWGGLTALDMYLPKAAVYDVSEATAIRFKYYNEVPQSNPYGHFRLILNEISDCDANCEDRGNMEVYFSFHQIFGDEPGWKTVTIDLVGNDSPEAPFWRTGWVGKPGNSQLDKKWLKAFTFEFNIGVTGGIGSSIEGTLLLADFEVINNSMQRKVPSSLVLDHFHVNKTYTENVIQVGSSSTIDTVDAPGEHDNAMAIQYSVEQSSGSGGSVGVETILKGIPGYYDCTGASYLEFSYQTSVPQSATGRADLQLTIFDGKGCQNYTAENCNSTDNLEWFVVTVTDALDDTDNSTWKHLKLRIDAVHPGGLQLDMTNGRVENGLLDTDFIKGFRIEFIIDGAGSIGSTSDGTIVMDELACAGDVFGANFAKTVPSWDPQPTDQFRIGGHNRANLDQLNTLTLLEQEGQNSLQVEYYIEQTEAWGGLTSIDYVLPGAAVYDVSEATHITFYFNNLVGQSNPYGQFRLILNDVSDCYGHACVERGNMEVYFSFHDILSVSDGWNKVSIELVGTDDPGSPLWRTGWVGLPGNRTFDKRHFKGYTLEWNIGVTGGIGSNTEGTLILSRLVVEYQNEENVVPVSCSTEQGYVLTDPLEFIEFKFKDCCDICDKNPDCVFIQTNERDCFLFGAPYREQISLEPSTTLATKTRFIGFQASKFGTACVDKCACNGDAIDCTAEELTMVPTFSESVAIKSVDLSGNAALSIVVANAFSNLTGLESLDLRNTNMTYISSIGMPSTLKTLDADVAMVANLVNLDVLEERAFDDICCHLDASLLWKNSNGDRLGTCPSVDRWEPCVDCVFEEFWAYFDESMSLSVVKGDDLFGDAASAPEICGELCSRTEGCSHFTWDGRHSIDEPICYLKTSDKGRIFLDSPTNWRDPDTYSPGYVSGYIAHTRANLHDAVVKFVDSTPAKLEVSAGLPGVTAKHKYSITLGSKPTRGAVWVYPNVQGPDLGTHDVDVSISPSRVVIYPDEWSKAHEITISLTPKSETGRMMFELVHAVEACDKAFTQGNTQNQDLKLPVAVMLPVPYEEKHYSNSVVTFSILLGVCNMGVGVTFLLWTVINRDHQVVKASQRSFLAMIAFGAIISSLTVFPLTRTDVDDTEGLAYTGDYGPANMGCMGRVYTYSLGFVVTMAPLLAKTRRLGKIVNRKDLKRVRISNGQVAALAFAIIAADMLIIVLWTALAPLKYVRIIRSTDEAGNPTESVGLCQSEEDSTPFLVLMIMFHIALLVYANYICYTVKNLGSTILSEGQYVQAACFANVQVLALSAPLLVIVYNDPVTSMFVGAGVIFLNDLTTQFLIFYPKIKAQRTGNFSVTPGSSGGPRTSITTGTGFPPTNQQVVNQ